MLRNCLFGMYRAPQPNLLDSQRLADSIQQAGLFFGKDLGNKSAFPSSFRPARTKKLTKFFSGCMLIVGKGVRVVPSISLSVAKSFRGHTAWSFAGSSDWPCPGRLRVHRRFREPPLDYLLLFLGRRMPRYFAIRGPLRSLDRADHLLSVLDSTC
jgi:hypothetical protein